MTIFSTRDVDERVASDMVRTNNRKARQRGFTFLQLLITVAVVSVVFAFALIKLGQVRDEMRLQNSVRQLASHIEKARLDSIRRHATGVDMASVAFTSTSTYNVKMDFDGTGTVSTRSFSFEDGVFVNDISLPSVTFNWRGRTSSCTITFTVQSGGGKQSWVDVSDAGDVTVNGDVEVLPTVAYANVNSSSGIATGTIVSGSGVHNNAVDCGEDSGGSGGSSTPAPPITGNGSSCTMTANPSSLTVKKNGGSTGNVTVSVTGSGTFTVTPSGPVNLSISPASRTISGGSSTTFSIRSLNNSRGTFAVNFSSSCTTVTVAVKVTN